MEPNKDVSPAVEGAYEQALEFAKPSEQAAQPTETREQAGLTDVESVGAAPEETVLPVPELASTSPALDKAYEQALELAEASESPTLPAPPDESEGLTEAGEFVQAVAAGEADQPAGTGRGQESGLPAEFERSEQVQEALDQWGNLDTDARLAVLYAVYREMGKSITPAAPTAADLELVQGFTDQFNALPKGDAQLQAFRAIARGEDAPLARAFGALTDDNKLAVLYLLAQRMGNDVVAVPGDYELSDAGKQHLEGLKGLGFEQQIQFLRDVVATMGQSTISRVE